MKLALLGVLSIVLIAQAADTAPGPGPFSNMGQVWLAVLVLAGQGLTQWSLTRRDKLALQREERQRQWLVEDREYVAKTAERLRMELLHEQTRVAAKLDENTDISRAAAATAEKAYEAANNVNLKLVAIGGARTQQGDPSLKRRAEEQR